MTITVLVADDQEMVRAGFGALLRAEPDIEVIGEAADGAAAIEQCVRLAPDVALMDIRMPVLDGIAALRELTARGSTTRVVMLTTFDLDEYVYDALRAGASGFLLKHAPPGQLATAVRTVAAGDTLLAPSITTRLIASAPSRCLLMQSAARVTISYARARADGGSTRR
jgi:DNA-binding NarL/FixJ family response regulator